MRFLVLITILLSRQFDQNFEVLNFQEFYDDTSTGLFLYTYIIL